MKRSLYPALLLALVGLTSCTVIRQGELGVKRTLGKIKPGTLPEGVQIFNPLLTRIIKLPTRTVNLEVRAPLPSKEGLTVQSDISILYRVEGIYAPRIVEQIGPSYADVLILPVFRSAVTDVSSRYFAKDMHTGQRAEIERSIRDVMTNQLKDRGFVIESVLLKSISLPAGLTKAIEDKLAAEQDAQRMQFVLDKERQEAQRRIIEAEGTRDAQKIISEGLTPMLIRFKTVEAFNRLSTSPNSKVIITNGDSPLMLNADRLDY